MAVACVLAIFSLSGCERSDLDPRTGTPAEVSIPDVPIEPPEDAPYLPPDKSEKPDEAILDLQKLLAAHGYDPGPVDGFAGKKTAAAISRFQADNGMEADGRNSPGLVEELKKQHKKMLQSGAPAEPGPRVKTLTIGYENADTAPAYEPGDVFIYSNGRIETVVRVGGNQVVWRGDDGSGYTSYPNFMLPWITWHKGSGAGRESAETDVGDLWPVPAGKGRSFQVKTSAEGAAGDTVRQWRCRGEGKKRVTVAAGVFDTIVFSCDRATPPSGEWKRRVWYYAPAVRHYIRRDEIRDGTDKTQRVELLALKPGSREWPPVARAGFGRAVEDTLQNKPTGDKIIWRSTVVATEFMISPTNEPIRRDGKQCRSYILVRGQLETARTYPAIACREPDTGRWFVAGTKHGTIAGAVANGNP